MEPPALPVKQHRSSSSRCSSVDCGPLSPVELHGGGGGGGAYSEVFPEATDCHAAQCPIHQRYDPSQHLMRFFSDDAPPPVPRKRLARTLSLPCADVPPPSPLSPLLRPPRGFDNPLYMMMPVQGRRFTAEAEHFEASEPGEPGSSSPYSQVSFDTPDAHLFGGFSDQREVLQGIERCHLALLRSMAHRVDAGILLQRDSERKEGVSYLPQDFVLQTGSEARQVGDAVYYGLHSPKFPGRLLALKVHRQTDESPSARAAHQPPHANVQEVVAHFRPANVTRGGSGHTLLQRADTEDGEPVSVQSLLQRGHPVSVERDLPLFTLEEFVQGGGASLQDSDYEGRLSTLLLQVLSGLAHLHQNGGSAPELRPREILLAWPQEGQEERGGAGAKEESGPQDKSGQMCTLWRTHGCPRVVLIPAGSSQLGPRPLLDTKSQISALIYFCLQPGESRASLGSGAAPSLQRRELLRLASRLRAQEADGPPLEAALAALQELVWGPSAPTYDPSGHGTACPRHWLTVKRALFVVKLAERGLSHEQRALPWEDAMRLKYLASADGEAAAGICS